MAAKTLPVLVLAATFTVGVATNAEDVSMPGQNFLDKTTIAVQPRAAFILRDVPQYSSVENGQQSSEPRANYDPTLGKPNSDAIDNRWYIKWGWRNVDLNWLFGKNLTQPRPDFRTMHEFNIGDKIIVLQEERSSLLEECIFFLIFAPIACIIAVLYKDQKKWPLPDSDSAGASASDMTHWSSGVCSCLDDPLSCFCACCCGWQRWADTISMTGLMAFWPAFALLVVISCLHVIPLFGIHFICLLAFTIVCTYYRQQMRGLFGMQAGGYTLLEDCICYCCCGCCLMAQEARHVELAAKLGHEVTALQAPLFIDSKFCEFAKDPDEEESWHAIPEV